MTIQVYSKKITEARNPKRSSKFVRRYGVPHSMLRYLMSLFIKIISLSNPFLAILYPISLLLITNGQLDANPSPKLMLTYCQAALRNTSVKWEPKHKNLLPKMFSFEIVVCKRAVILFRLQCFKFYLKVDMHG